MAKRGLAVVTGGSRGIGHGIAKELAEMGYDLFLLAKDPSRLKKTADELSTKYKVKVDYFACDLSDTGSIDSFHKSLVSKKLIPDVLVSNAGVFLPGSTADTKMELFDEMIAVNLKGMFYITQKLMPLLAKGKDKRIILTSSIWALDSYPAEGREEATLYAISKWAIRGWARSLRAEVRKDNIGVTVIYPGETFTDEWEGTTIPKERFMKPEDIGKIVRAVLSTSPQTVIEEVVVRPIKWSYPLKGWE
jgi:short-subunit dehydrogenase